MKILTSVIPVGSYDLTKENIKDIINHSSVFRSSLNIFLAFSGPHRHQDHVQFLKDTEDQPISDYVSSAVCNSASPGSGRNLGISRATTPYVCFWDDDDLPEPQAILEALNDKSVNRLYVFQYQIQQPFESPKSPPFRTMNLFELFFTPAIWRLAIPRQYLHGASFSDSLFGEDHEFLSCLLSQPISIKFVSESSYIYVRRPASLSHRRSIDGLLISLSGCIDLFEQSSCHRIARGISIISLFMVALPLIFSREIGKDRHRILLLLSRVLCTPTIFLALPLYFYFFFRSKVRQSGL
jgi:glycosyltransferase involved in cell wall biosynthesis